MSDGHQMEQTRELRREAVSGGLHKGSNLIDVKSLNLSVVLDAIRRYGPISRTELAALTELTSATITNVTSQLLDLKLIEESGSVRSKGGRKRILLMLSENAYWTIGIEISRNHISAVLLNLGGGIIKRAYQDIEAHEGPVKSIERLKAMVQSLLSFAETQGQKVIGIGIGVPGPVNTQEGVVISPPNFPGWHWIPLKSEVEQMFDLPVFVDDDAKTSALGEAWFGAGRDVQSLVYLSIGTGIGAGVVVDGRLYRGTHELAGQIGHMTLDINGPRCECSNVGCLEVLAAVPALLGAVQEALADGASSSLADLSKSRTLTVEDICLAAGEGDPLARQVLGQAERYLGAAVINTVNLYDPEMIILGGRLVRAHVDLIDGVRSQVRERAFSFAADTVTILPARLQGDASSVGAATMVVECLIDEPAEYLAAVRV